MQVVLAIQNRNIRLALQLYLDAEPDLSVVGIVTEAASLRALLWTVYPDLVILDWDLPGLNVPIQLLAEAKRLQACPQVIVLGRDECSRQKALAAGADMFAVSGDPPGDLMAAIRQSRARYRDGIRTAADLGGGPPQAAAGLQIDERTKEE